MKDLERLNYYRVNPDNSNLYRVPYENHFLNVIADSRLGWDHVSVSIPGMKRLPTWYEMKHIKELFFEDWECVFQFHPPLDEYQNLCEVLHLWQPLRESITLPPSKLVGASPPRLGAYQNISLNSPDCLPPTARPLSR